MDIYVLQVRKEATNGPTSTKELRVGKKGRKRNKFLVVELKELGEEKNKANLDAEIHLSSPQVEDTIRLTSLMRIPNLWKKIQIANRISMSKWYYRFQKIHLHLTLRFGRITNFKNL